MLRSLTIHDFILVDSAELEFGQGFSVLTGETGAGKSILLGALTLVLGGRGETGVVRAGADRADVAAIFDLAARPDLLVFIVENDLGDDAAECLLRRVIDAQGRSRAYINGRPATLAQLREIGEGLVDLYGQHEHQSLLRPEAQRHLLDDFGGLSELSRNLAAAWRHWRGLQTRRAEAALAGAQLAIEREALSQRIDDLSVLALGNGEWQDLCTKQARLAHASGLLDAAAGALQAIADDDGSCEERLSQVAARLAGMTQYDSTLEQTVALLESALIQLREAALALRRYEQRLELDPAELQAVEARLSAIHQVARKHRVRPEELPQLLETSRARMSELNNTLDSEALAGEESRAQAAYVALGAELSAGRREAATLLAGKVTATMQSLALEGGEFEVALHSLAAPASYGMEQIEFLVSAHPGLPRRPLAKVASGGELSRLSLAIQVVTTEVAQVATLIFDEVDAGIGGGVAERVGQLLRSLGATRQVLCVTHLPQVAARAHRHYVVSKADSGGGAKTVVRRLGESERVEEIARMLGGMRITDKTLAHAREMLGSQASPHMG